MATIGIGQSPTRDRIMPDIRPRNVKGYLSAEKFGDWNVSKRFFRTLPLEIKRRVYKAQLQFAREYLGEIFSQIRGGSWEPYSANYRRYKKSKKGLDENSFFQFQSVFISELKISEYPDKHMVRVGINPKSKATNMSGSLTVHEYMNIVEHGSFWHNVKKRPLFSTAFRQVGGKARLSKIVHKQIGHIVKTTKIMKG